METSAFSMAAKLRVTIVGPVYPYRGGISHFTTRLARALEQHGHTVQVVSFRRQYPAWLYPGQSDRDPSQQRLDIVAEYLLDPFFPWTWRQSARHILQFRPDIVVLQWWTTFWAPAFLALARQLNRKGAPASFLIHNVLPHEAGFWDPWVARLVLRQGRAFIALTGQEKQRLLALVPGRPVEVCPLPVFDMFTGQQAPREEARRHLGLPSLLPVVLFFGIVRPYKGLETLLDAIARLRERGLGTRLIVAGEFWEAKDKYLRQIERLGLAEQVRLEDRYIPNEEVARYFSAADVFAAPYTSGTQSGAVKLAMSFGLPVVASQCAADAILAGQPDSRVVITPPGDAQALAQGIEKALEGLGRPGDAGFHHPQQLDESSWAALVAAIERLARRPPG
jgi:glycosyltransferase involved in cell wall biosynthesis